jgi:hypothetical protein
MASLPAMRATAWSAARQNACGRAHVRSVHGSKNAVRTLAVERKMANPVGCLENGSIRSQQDRAENDDRDRCPVLSVGEAGVPYHRKRAHRRWESSGPFAARTPPLYRLKHVSPPTRGRETRQCELPSRTRRPNREGKTALHTSVVAQQSTGATAVRSSPDPVAQGRART